MSMIVWILLGLVLGLVASKIVSTTGEGTVVDILARHRWRGYRRLAFHPFWRQWAEWLQP